MNAKVTLVIRILLGLLFLITGTNGLMMVFTGKGFLPTPPLSPAMMGVFGAFITLKYLLPLVKVLEVTAALCLLSGRFVNLAIVLLAPIAVNILCVHTFIDTSGLPIALFITILLVLLIKARWQYFKPLVQKN